MHCLVRAPGRPSYHYYLYFTASGSFEIILQYIVAAICKYASL